MTRGEGSKGGKQGKELDKELAGMTHGHGQQCGRDCGSWRWEGRRRAKGENWDSCTRITIKMI